jgi:hypothetical protein
VSGLLRKRILGSMNFRKTGILGRWNFRNMEFSEEEFSEDEFSEDGIFGRFFKNKIFERFYEYIKMRNKILIAGTFKHKKIS